MTPEPTSPLDAGVRKRVCKACDRCRLKKSKVSTSSCLDIASLLTCQCDGASPCSRCKADNAICVFGDRKKSHDKVYPKGYVEMLETQQAQLVAGLQELYRRTQNGQGWTGPALKETSAGVPLTHDILERLGALKQEGQSNSETFEEDLHALQARLIAQGATMMERSNSHDASSDSSSSPPYDIHSKANFSAPYPVNKFPPTPPSQSPYPHSTHALPPIKSHSYPATTSNLNWSTPVSDFDENMEMMKQYDSPMVDSGMDTAMSFPHMFQEQQLPPAINPMFMMKDWSQQEEFQHYVNPAMI
ncbi:hypothetical protein DV735_g3567, partial [Chaetothyriales sp. CBS 134920]